MRFSGFAVISDHIILRTERANLSKSMQWFGATYTRRFNVRHKRSGHLFQGRFKNFLVENDDYLLRLSCYIHRNPLRAGIVKRLADYKWSSYPVYAYGRGKPGWLNTNPILSQFEGPPREKRKKYRRKVRNYSGEEEKLWEDFKHGLFLGAAGFADKIRAKYLPVHFHKEKARQRELKKAAGLDATVQQAERIVGCDFNHMKRGRIRLFGDDKTNRDFLVLLLWETGIYSNGDIGEYFGLTYSSVSKTVSILRQRFLEDKKLWKRYENIRSQFKM